MLFRYMFNISNVCLIIRVQTLAYIKISIVQVYEILCSYLASRSFLGTVWDQEKSPSAIGVIPWKLEKYVYSHQTMVYTIIHHIHLKTEGNYFLVEIVSLTNATNDIMKYKIDIISLYITIRTPFGFKYPLATYRLRTIR